MKAFLFFCLLFSTFRLSAQTDSCVGTYRIEIDTNLDQKDQYIYILLSLGTDSLFSYEMVGLFHWCRTSVFAGKGKWFYENGWIYLKPQDFMLETDNFILTPPQALSLDEKAGLYSMQGYEGIPVVRDKNNRMAVNVFLCCYDCFRFVWGQARNIPKIYK